MILPVTALDEEHQRTTQESMFNYVRHSDGGIFRMNNARTEIEVLADIASRTVGDSKVNFKGLADHNKLREAIAATIPGYEKIKKLDETKEEFIISGRIFHTPEFATPDKKANFRICPTLFIKAETDSYRMMTVRTEGQFNSIIYEETDLYRGQKHRWCVLMNKKDIRKAGLQVNDKVTLKSDVGVMKDVVVREFDIPCGNILTYYPEANV